MRVNRRIVTTAICFLVFSFSAAPAQDSFSEGTHLVGKDIQPGRYRTTDEVNYFARLSGVSGQLDDIIANGAFTSGPVVVDIKENDFAFQSSGDATWVLLDDSYQPEIRSSFGDGWWIVGVDIAPGVYRTSDEVSYFARLSGFGHELADVIVNEAFTSGSSTIEIMSTDVGFETQGGATWSRVDLSVTKIESATWGTIKLRQHK